MAEGKDLLQVLWSGADVAQVLNNLKKFLLV